MIYQKLLQKYPLVSDQVDAKELAVILRELQAILDHGPSGAVVEFGCYTGTTSLFIARMLQASGSSRALHVYDSFAGLPEKNQPDTSPVGQQFRGGELRASRQALIRNFKQAGLPLPTIHKAWFADLAASDIPTPIAFAFLDGDFYYSIKDSLRLVQANLSPGATIVIDDYQSEALPGVAKATHEWLRTHPKYHLKTEASLALLTC